MEHWLLDRRRPVAADAAELLAGGEEGRARALQRIRESAGRGARRRSAGGGPHGHRKTDKRDAKQNEELSTLLSSVRTEIEMAQILGYGKKADFKPIFDQVKSIEQKSAGGKSGKGWFDELKTRIQKLF